MGEILTCRAPRGPDPIWTSVHPAGILAQKRDFGVPLSSSAPMPDLFSRPDKTRRARRGWRTD